MKYIIVFGNLSDGFNFRGPFDTFDEASNYADQAETDEISWIAELNPAEPAAAFDEPNK